MGICYESIVRGRGVPVEDGDDLGGRVVAVVGVGACLTLDADGTCTAARISLGAVAPTALGATAAAQALGLA